MWCRHFLSLSITIPTRSLLTSTNEQFTAHSAQPGLSLLTKKLCQRLWCWIVYQIHSGLHARNTPNIPAIKENHLKFGWGLHTVLLMCCSCAIWSQWLSGKSIQLAPFSTTRLCPCGHGPQIIATSLVEQNKHHPCLVAATPWGEMLGNFCSEHEEQPNNCHFLRYRRWAIWEVNGRRKQGMDWSTMYVHLCSKPMAHTECFSPMSQHHPSTGFHF